jgi:transporter family protein
METWKLQAILAAVFAGLTSVLAKSGLTGLSADTGLAIRTAVVFLVVSANAFAIGGTSEIGAITARNLALLALSGVTTSLSWIFYYRAMKTGTVSTVALIDKGSIIITLLLSFSLLREPFTARVVLGAALILAGVGVLSWKI